MREVHQGGEKCFVDYAGTLPSIIDPAMSQVIQVHLFVAVLGASVPPPIPWTPARSLPK